MLALHLHLHLHVHQSALVHVNTLLMQEVLAEPKWTDRLTDADRRALSPLFRTHVNPAGTSSRTSPYLAAHRRFLERSQVRTASMC
ncbi:Tn3 family transposase [Streptomyces noursei]|uniref:Uncharacterized protein n=2 Tax=Streptomyces noursei TaxID=1971 RepID=A0A059VNR6_STRNR|nr:Tn3 family transposase [Streptomyces noursei]AIA01004.1 putative transposase [Streptomyces noursei]GCB88610.1 hypothetical protein SALB_01281 [Streptomyces noursei]